MGKTPVSRTRGKSRVAQKQKKRPVTRLSSARGRFPVRLYLRTMGSVSLLGRDGVTLRTFRDENRRSRVRRSAVCPGSCHAELSRWRGVRGP